jgi:molybdate transport system substrate-binding protein
MLKSLLFCLFLLPSALFGQDKKLLIAAAADLKVAFTEIGQAFDLANGSETTFSFGSTGELTTQILNGAKFDLLAAANTGYIDTLAAHDLILPDTKKNYAQGRIVLAVNPSSGITATTLVDLTKESIKRIAIANPDHAPYGMAAKQALIAAGVWEQVKPKLVYGENIRTTLQYVQTGNAEVGIISLSLMNGSVAYTLIDSSLHKPLTQALAVIRTTRNEPLARAFSNYLFSKAGQAVMKKYGFTLPK